MTTATKDCFLLEKCGDRRQAFGPYDRASAFRAMGNQYMVVRGSLSNNKVLLRSAVLDLVHIGSLEILSGDSIDSI